MKRLSGTIKAVAPQGGPARPGGLGAWAVAPEEFCSSLAGRDPRSRPAMDWSPLRPPAYPGDDPLGRQRRKRAEEAPPAPMAPVFLAAAPVVERKPPDRPSRPGRARLPAPSRLRLAVAILFAAATAIGAWHHARREAAEPKPALREGIEAGTSPGRAAIPLPPSRPRDLTPAPAGR
ncbi:hypothetical protein [Bosea sp. (in: a-proteobacteria)]|uniref:hypothetical protein n=1 Tax=Bosea sp. (in: a-proteobacteria) TaxID=1871050 RepID=UPI003340950E